MNRFRSKARGQYLAIILFLIFMLACGGTSSTPTTLEPSETASTETATQTGASPTETPAASPAPVGTSPENPAPSSETVSTTGWEFYVVEAVRGDEALAMLEAASPFNKEHPDPSMEYVLVNVHVKYTETGPSPTNHVDNTFFRGMDSAKVLYDKVSIIDVDAPSPSISSFEDLSIGDEVEGWAVMQVGKDASGIMLVILPRDNGLQLGDETIRYISLE